MLTADIERMLDEWAIASSLPAALTDRRLCDDPRLHVWRAPPVCVRPCVAIEWTMSGTNSSDWAGMPATGRHFASVRCTSILELEDGKIHRHSDYWDAATVMKQVGLRPSR